MLTVRNLHKSIDRKPVLREVSFTLGPGQVAGLVGRNGAGKTTLLRTMAGILDADVGTVEYEGLSVHRHPSAKKNIVFVPDQIEAWYGYSAYGCADWYAQIYPRFDRTYFKEMMRGFGLPLDRNVRHFSKGMKMMFAVGLGLATKAPYVLLDEPTNGIDPICKKQVLSKLMEAASDGMSLLVSSHLLEELERMTDTILLLREGTVETHSSHDVADGRLVKLQVAFEGDPPTNWLASPDVRVLNHIGRVYTLLVRTEAESTAYAELKQLNPLLMEPLPVRLEDLYVWRLEGESDVG